MAAQLPIKETVDASDAVFSSKTPSDAELSFDDKRRSSPTKRVNGDREQGLLQSEYRNATEMACSSSLHNGGVEDNDVDNTGDWKTTLGGNPNRFHPQWGPPIPRKGMTMTIGNGSKSEKIEWDPFFGPPVMKSRGVPKLTKAVEDGGDRSRVGLMANYHWEGLENGPISSPALLVPQRQQPYQIGAPPGGMIMNPQQQQQQHQLQQQLQMMTQQLQQQQANGQPITPQQQQQHTMMQQQYHMMMQQQHQFQQQQQMQQGGQQQPMNPQQQQMMMMQQMQRQQQQSGGQPFTPQQQQMMMQQMQQQQGGMQQQPNNGNLANQQQQQYPTYAQPQQQQQEQQQQPAVVDQREPYSVPLSGQSSLGLELDNVAGGNTGSVGSAVSSSLDVDGVTARRVGTSPPSHSNQVDDDDL